MDQKKYLMFIKRYWPYLVCVILVVIVGSFSYAYWGKSNKNQGDYTGEPAKQYQDNSQLPFDETSDQATETEEANTNTESDNQISSKQKSAHSSSSINTTQTPDSGSSDSSPSGSEGEPEPTPESPSAYVAFYADNQSDSDEDDFRHTNVVNRIMSSGANPIIHAGDIMEDGTQDSFDRFLNVAGALLGSRTFYAALGNNDRLYGDSGTPSPIFLNYFNFPNNEKWYSINSGNLHVVILDSAFSSSDANQLSWLSSDLQSSASQSRITVVVFHHPTFVPTVESYLQNYGVDFVICGHVHVYSKSYSAGIYRFTLPGGTEIGHATATVYNDYANLNFYNLNGSLIETIKVNER